MSRWDIFPNDCWDIASEAREVDRKPEIPKKSTVVVGQFGCKCAFGAIILFAINCVNLNLLRNLLSKSTQSFFGASEGCVQFLTRCHRFPLS